MIWPGLAVDATADGDAASDDAGADATAEAGPTEGVAPPHAPTASMTTKAKAANRLNLVLPIPLLLFLRDAIHGAWKRGAGPQRTALRSLSSSLSAALHSIA